MRIEIYLHGKHLTSKSPLYAMANCLAFIRSMEKPGFLKPDEVVDSLHEMMESHFDEWFEGMIKSHELHIVDIEGNRLYDQYLVSEEINNED